MCGSMSGCYVVDRGASPAHGDQRHLSGYATRSPAANAGVVSHIAESTTIPALLQL